jgi:hypothetical protein
MNREIPRGEDFAGIDTWQNPRVERGKAIIENNDPPVRAVRD